MQTSHPEDVPCCILIPVHKPLGPLFVESAVCAAERETPIFLPVFAEPNLAEDANDGGLVLVHLHYAKPPFKHLSDCRSGRFTAFQFTPSRPIPIEDHAVLTVSCCSPVEEHIFTAPSSAEDPKAPVTPQLLEIKTSD